MENASRLVSLMALVGMAGCNLPPAPPPPPPSPQDELIAKGRELFVNETFGGNGRTCATCHPAENSFTIDPAFIAKLPPNDPLFVAEFVPALAQNFEDPKLMREFGLIKENLDGFSDLANKFVMRGVPHVLGMRSSVASPAGPRTGWSGDGAPGDGSLRSFATGAVIQHFTKTLNRVPGADFRLPTPAELDAMEAFQLSLGRREELKLPLALKGTVAKRGQAIFMDNGLGKCNVCHVNAGANVIIPPATALGNANLNTGVEALPDQPAKLSGARVPVDDGFGTPGDSTFNVPSVVEAADTGPFFHNNVIETIEGAVAFYNGDSFKNSPIGQILVAADPNRVAIKLDGTQVVEVAAFLRVINAIENIRQAGELLADSRFDPPPRREKAAVLLRRARAENADAIRVLAGGGLHPDAVTALQAAQRHIERAAEGSRPSRGAVDDALAEQARARDALVAR
jgi:mono/diheme cytochrome c family protein